MLQRGMTQTNPAGSEPTHLFAPLEIRGVSFRNRIGVSPMCEYSSEDGFANDWHFVHLGSRAVGGAAMVMTEASAVLAEDASARRIWGYGRTIISRCSRVSFDLSKITVPFQACNWRTRDERRAQQRRGMAAERWMKGSGVAPDFRAQRDPFFTEVANA